jgi:PKD repeat protein
VLASIASRIDSIPCSSKHLSNGTRRTPVNPVVGDGVIFNADQVQAAPGHTIVQYSWNFGDGGIGSGFQTTHVFTQANTYSVVLSALDDAGQKSVIPHSLTVGTGNPAPVITSSPATPVHGVTSVGFSANGSGG